MYLFFRQLYPHNSDLGQQEWNLATSSVCFLLRGLSDISTSGQAIFSWQWKECLIGLLWQQAVFYKAWASYQIRKIAGCACAGNAGNVFPRRRFQSKPLVSDPGMHHGTCVTHVPWCMSGSLTRGDRENVPGIPGACAPTILRIWPIVTMMAQFITNTTQLLLIYLPPQIYLKPMAVKNLRSQQLLLWIRSLYRGTPWSIQLQLFLIHQNSQKLLFGRNFS